MLKNRFLITFFAALTAANMLFSIPCKAAEPVRMKSCVYPIYLTEETEMLPLSREYFEMRLGLAPGELLAITITSMPNKSNLMLDGVEVEVYDTLLAGDTDRLSYYKEEGEGWFSFIPICKGEKDDSDKICATFTINQAEKPYPSIKEVFCQTLPERKIGTSFSQEEGERAVYTLLKKPLQGKVKCSGESCDYTPNSAAEGEDSFSLVALYQNGMVSAPIPVQVKIQK